MKNRLLYSVLCIGGLMLTTGCNDFLDHVPDNRAELNSKENIRELLVSAYPDQAYVQFLEVMSDNAGDRGVFLLADRPTEEAYNWKDATSVAQDTPGGFWSSCYTGIAHSNHALRAIEELGNTKDLDPQVGEALVTRAYLHFMLVNIFAQNYDPNYSKTDLGIPYVTEPHTTVTENYRRMSVDSVYKMIVKDFEEGVKKIKDSEYGGAPKYHFTVNAANAFGARLYLTLGEFDKAIHYANLVLGDTPVEHLRDMKTYSKFSTSKKPTAFTSVEEPSILLLTSCISTIARYQPFYQYGLTSEIKSEMVNQNMVNKFIRKNGIKKKVKWYYSVVSYTVSNEYNNALKWEEYFLQSGLYANTGFPCVMVPVIGYEDVLFDRAEAYAMKGLFTESLKDINSFLSTRVVYDDDKNEVYDPATMTLTDEFVKSDYTKFKKLTPFYAMSDDQAAYVNCILELRRREFLTEGKRWFDVKRYGIEVSHTPYNQPDEVDKLIVRDLRRAVQIPDNARAQGIEANPR